MDLPSHPLAFFFAHFVEPGCKFAELFPRSPERLLRPLVARNVANGHGGGGGVFPPVLNRTEAEAVPPFLISINTGHLTRGRLTGIKSSRYTFFHFDGVGFGYVLVKPGPGQCTGRITPRRTVDERDSRLAIDGHDRIGSVFDKRIPIIQSLLQ